MNEPANNGYKQTDIGTIPIEWEEVRLGDFFKLSSGASRPVDTVKSRLPEYPYPIYGGNGILGYSARYFIDDPALVIGRVGAYCGNSYVSEPKSWISDNALYTKEVHKEFDFRFMCQFLNYQDLNRLRNLGGQPLINQSIVHELKVALPPLPEQRAIATILSKIQHAIEVQEKIIERTKELKKSLMAKLFTEGLHGEELKETEIGLMPKSWEVVMIDTLFECHDGKRVPVTKADRTAGKFPYYGASGITDYVNDYIFDGDFLLVAEDGENLESRKLPIAFIASGKFWVNNHAHILKIRKGSQKFYEQYVAQMDITDYLTGTTRPKLTKGLLMNMRVPKPHEEEQEEIGQRLNLIEEKANIHTRKRSALQALFKSMLHQLMTGRIRVNNIEIAP